MAAARSGSVKISGAATRKSARPPNRKGAVTIRGDRIVELDFILRPDRLRRIDLEALAIAATR